VKPQLLHNVSPVRFDGLGADAKLKRDLLRASCFGNELDDLPFPWRYPGWGSFP
jgi:hypothetical protein